MRNGVTPRMMHRTNVDMKSHWFGPRSAMLWAPPRPVNYNMRNPVIFKVWIVDCYFMQHLPLFYYHFTLYLLVFCKSEPFFLARRWGLFNISHQRQLGVFRGEYQGGPWRHDTSCCFCKSTETTKCRLFCSFLFNLEIFMNNDENQMAPFLRYWGIGL